VRILRTGLALVLSTVLITTILAVAPSSAAVKAGAKCSKAGATSVSAEKGFTCVKKGKKLVWKKGIAVKSQVRPVKPAQPAAAPLNPVEPAPASVPEVSLPTEGSSCSKIGAKVNGKDGFMKCIWAGGATNDFLKNIQWRFYPVSKISSNLLANS
jgi:hypothetical protein